MLAPLPPHRRRPVRPFGHRDRAHAAGQDPALELQHLHPLAHDEVVVRVYRSVGLVLDEFPERLQCGARFVLRGGEEGDAAALEGEVMLPMLGEMLVDGGPMEKGDVWAVGGLVLLPPLGCIGPVVEGRCRRFVVSRPMWEISMPSW